MKTKSDTPCLGNSVAAKTVQTSAAKIASRSCVLQARSATVYALFRSKRYVYGSGFVDSYGIEACDSEHTVLTDISADRAFVEQIIAALNANQVSYIHFLNVVEDLMC